MEIAQMAKHLSFLLIFFILISPSIRGKKVYESKRYVISLSHKKAQGFSTLKNRYFYQAFLFGNKSKIRSMDLSVFKRLGVMHLMTPSGLHLSSILFFLVLLRKKSKNLYLVDIEIIISVLIYSGLPGFYALRRVALLNSFKLLNDRYLNKKLNSIELFMMFLLIDYSTGTYSYSIISFFLSVLFILIFKLRGENKFYLFLNLFIGQVLTAFIFSNKVGIFNILLSPIYTIVFTCLYPLMVLNYFFIEFFNYSDFIINFLRGLINLFDKFNTHYYSINILDVLIFIFVNRYNFLFFTGVYLLINIPIDSF